MIRTDSVVKAEGMQVLLDKLGRVDAERFISLIIKESYDYTKRQKELFDGMSVKELSNAAMNDVSE